MSSEPTVRLQRCRRVLAASRDGYWERELRSGKVWYSESFYTMLGLRPGDAGLEQGRIDTRLHPDDRDRLRAAYRDALRRRGDFDYEIRFLDGAGHWCWLRGRGQVWAGADGQPEFVCGACTNVQRERLLLATLDEQTRRLEAQVNERTESLAAALHLAENRRAEAESANAAKSRWLTHLSHEIRTPLSALLALTELALRGAHSADQRRYLEQAQLSGDALQLMVSDVLDLARIESGQPELRPRDFDLAESMAATLRALMPLAGQRELILLFDHSGSEAWLRGDEVALRQIVTNLVGNAIKYTERGRVRLSVQAQVQFGGTVAVEIQVADDGPGIAAQRQPTIFEPFVRAREHAEAPATGAGMGLAIARGLARAMNGTLALHCPPEGGAVFTLALTLPLALQQPAAEPKPETGTAWLVHGHAAAGQWLQRRMARHGWQCVLFADLPAMLAAAQQAEGPGPRLLLVAHNVVHAGSDLRPLRRALPEALMHLLIRPDWHAPLLEAQARSLQILPLMAPLTPRQLRRLGLPPAAGDAPVRAAAATVPTASTTALPAATAAAAPTATGTTVPTALGSTMPTATGTTEPAAMAAENSAVPPAEPAAQLEGGMGGEVLLVEDNEVNQLVGREFLQALGLRVRVARDGREAMAACAAHPPALVLMDLRLPDMDGCDVTERLRGMERDGQWPGAPILALTAFATQDDQALCHAAGMNGVLAKPLSLDMLRRELQRWQVPTTP